MSKKFPPHAELTSVLYSDDFARAVEFIHLLPVNGNKAKKPPVIPAPMRERFAHALQQIFAVNNSTTDISPGDLEQNEKLKQHIIEEFPALIIAGLGDEKSLKQLRDKYTLPLHSELHDYKQRDDAKRALLKFERYEKARELMRGINIELPVIERPTQPVAEIKPLPVEQLKVPEPSSEQAEKIIQPDALLSEEPPQPVPETIEAAPFKPAIEPEQPPITLDLPVEQPQIFEPPAEPVVVETAQTEEGVQSPAVFTSIVAAENGHSHAETAEPKVIAAPLDNLTEDELIEREIKRIEAFNETRTRLLDDAQMYLMQAQNKGFNRFECRIGLNRPGFPIQLQFSMEVDVEGEKKIRKFNKTLDNYMQAYTERGIPLTMNDAVDLKIAVQSMICNTDGIMAIHDPSAAGQRTVELDTQMPLPVLDYKVIQRSGGMYSLIFTAQDPYSRQIIYPSIPLGVAARHENEEAERRELDDRTQYVVDYLHGIGNKRTPEGHRVFVTKRDVLMKLQSYLEENNKEWVTKESIELPGFNTNTLLYVSSQGSQKITLAPLTLRMDAGGDNPSWSCSLPFYIGDKNRPPMGELVRTRYLNLHTRNRRLAVARALESLVGVRSQSGEQVVEGFLPHLQRHMRLTGHEWRVENRDTPQEEVFIGNQPLQFFLDDMMRYERDIGIKLDKREVDATGNVTITVQALRSLTGDYGKTARFTPEHVHESNDDERKPVAFTLIVSSNNAERIEKFIQAAHEHARWHADEAYSSIALGADGQPDKRKKPLIYRTSQIRQSIIRAIEELHQECFGQRLPKGWHKLNAQGVGSCEPPKKEKAYRQHLQPMNGEDRHARYVRRSRNPWGNSPTATLG